MSSTSVFPEFESEAESVRPVDWMDFDGQGCRPLFGGATNEAQPLDLQGKQSRARNRLSEVAPDELDMDPSTPAPAIPPDPRLPTPPPGATAMVNDVGAVPGELAEIQAELEARTEAFGRAACELAAARAHIMADAEEELLGLAVEIAQAILETHLERDVEHHRTLARAAVRALAEPSHVALKASQRAYEALSDVFGQTTLEVDKVTVDIQLDSSLAGLGCVAETEEGSVDGTVEARLNNVRRALNDELRRQRSENEG